MFNIDYGEIEFIEVHGLRRSGNHAIIAWLIKNMSSYPVESTKMLVSPFPEAGFLSQRAGDVYHINDAGAGWSVGNPAYVRGLIDAYISEGAKKIIISYEDVSFLSSLYKIDRENLYFLKGAKKIVITRNLANLLASRIKASLKFFGIPNEKKSVNGFYIGETIIEKWAINEKFNGLKINYEDWLTLKNYRDEVSKSLGIENRDITSEISNAGGGSSFKQEIDKEMLLKRYTQVSFPDEVIKLMKSKLVSEVMLENYGFDYSNFEFNQIP